jgi:hypothetical protein
MLPGFRFLFAAIVLSMSILVFGLGAAALLRAAHEEFASVPTWRAAPETVFAQPAEATPPVLALLRVDAPVTEKATDHAPADATPAAAAVTSAPAEPERVAALKPEDSPPPETAKPEVPASESPAPSEAASAPAEPPASANETKTSETKAAEIKPTETGIAETKTAETTIAETRIAMLEDIATPAIQAATPAAPEPISAPASPEADMAATKIATLGGPAVTIAMPPQAKAESAKPEASIIKKRQHARREAQRRRLAVHASAAVQVPQQPGNPFGQPAPTIVRRR